MKTKLFISLFGLISLLTRVNGQNDSVPNFFAIKAFWELKLAESAEEVNENGEKDAEMEDGNLANFNRWVAFWRYRLGPNGEMTTANIIMNQLKKDESKSRSLSTICDSPYDNLIYWTNLGPFNSQGALANGGSQVCTGYMNNKQNQGRVESISVKPGDQNEILIGGLNSGIWRTVNGGTNWTNTTDDEGFSWFGINSIVRHPADPKIIYASTGVSGGNWEGTRKGYGIGVIMSIDWGVTWQTTGLSYNPEDWNSRLGQLAIDPNSTLADTKLYVCSPSDIWKWQGNELAAGAWTSVWHDDPQYYNGPLWYGYVNNADIESASNGDIWFANYIGIFKIPSGSNTAILITNYTIPANFVNQPSCGNPAQNLKQEISIDINNQGHIVFYCKFRNCSSFTEQYFYKSTDNGNTWTFVMTPFNGYPPQQFVLNPQNSDMIYGERGNSGTLRCMSISTNGGLTFSQSMGNSQNHVDPRTMLAFSGTQSNGSDNVLYLGTDGGISKTTDGNNWVDISGQGLSITNYYGVGISETNDKMIFAGAQDGSINYYNSGNWYETLPGGDNGDCLINSPGNSMIIQEGNDNVYQGNLNGNNWAQTNLFQPSVPMQFLNPLCWNPAVSNEFFVGTDRCYIGTASNSTLTPIYNSNLHPPKDISSVAVSRNNPDVVYYSTDLFWWQPTSITPEQDGIFKGTRSGGSWTVTDITNGLKTKCNPSGTICGLVAPITDITVDPNDENRIWVAFGGFVNQHKVFYTSDGGINWQNISNCLPNVPVTAIVFQEMSNDRLYIGTDNGMYYRDNIQTDWAKYGNNGPQCSVNDLEINQCAGKLVAATFGRGLWEAPLIKSPEGTTIIGVINWNSPRTIASDLRIVSGSTLNINNTKINIGQGVKIIVEAGAVLQLTNDTLTNECGYVWDGIKVWGNAGLIQNGTNQGTLIINNSIIEHATEAIEVIKQGDMTKTGGIVKAKDSKFLNNKRSVAYYRYLTSINQGYFYNCVFKTDGSYRHASPLLSHVYMSNVEGIRLWGCTFQTDNSWPYDVNRVQGITAIDANFTVDAYCTANFLPCPTPEIRSKFIGFNTAINTSRTWGTYTFSVYESDFQNNVFGVITSAHNNFNIRDCTFRVGKTNASGAPSTHEGLVIMSGTGFKVDQNTFRPTFNTIAPNTIGIRAKDTGTEINEIYKNSFIKSSPTDLNVFYGNLANGLNRNTLINNNGLKYYCNNNINNKRNGYDFAVTDQGIAYSQGSLNDPAENIFSWGTQLTGAPAGSDFNNGAITGPIIYYYNSAGQEEPINIFAISKFLTSSNANTCPNGYDPGGVDPVDPNPYDPDPLMGPPEGYAQAGEDYAVVRQNLNSDLNTINSLMDGGNKPDLLVQINNLEESTKNALIDRLEEIAPFISLEVMEALFLKLDNPLTKSEFKEIALTNPDVFVTNALTENCISSGIFNQSEVDTLLKLVTERNTLENHINDLYSEMYSICNTAISFIVDYPELFSSQEIVTWLFNKNSLYSNMEIVDHLINQLNFSEARMLLYNLEEKYHLPDDEKAELNYFIQVKEVQIKLIHEGLGIDALSQEVKAILEPIAMNSKGLGGDQARTILNQNGYNYFVPPVFPANSIVKEPEAEVQAIAEKSLVVTENEVNSLTASPNPASSEIDFSVKLQSNLIGFIILRDHTGNIVATLTVKDNPGFISWNCENLTPGIYFYSLEAEGQLLIAPKNILILR